MALPGAKLPCEIVRIAQQCGLSPHLSYPLRQINDLQMDLRLIGTGQIIGNIGLDQALREAYTPRTGSAFTGDLVRKLCSVVQNRRFSTKWAGKSSENADMPETRINPSAHIGT